MSVKWIPQPTEKALQMSKKSRSGKRKTNTVDMEARRMSSKRMKDDSQT